MGGLLDLPRDILIELPEYMEVIEDLVNLSTTCRGLRELYYEPSPRLVLRLCSDSNLPFFRPLRYFLVAAVAEQLADWASRSQANVLSLRESCREGMDGLLDLCIAHCGLTMSRLRELHALKSSAFELVIDRMDKCCGHQWYAQENFWDTVDDAVTVDSEPQIHFYQLAIYGGLFGATLRAYLERGTMITGSSGVIVGDVQTRMEFVKYCIPDDNAMYNGNDEEPINPLRHVEAIGPYESSHLDLDSPSMRDSQTALLVCIKSRKFNKFWESVRLFAGPDFPNGGDEWDPPGWKQRIWQTTIHSHGLNGFHMMTDEEGALAWQPQLVKWRNAIDQMPTPPKHIFFRRVYTYEFPWLRGDLSFLIGWGL